MCFKSRGKISLKGPISFYEIRRNRILEQPQASNVLRSGSACLPEVVYLVTGGTGVYDLF